MVTRMAVTTQIGTLAQIIICSFAGIAFLFFPHKVLAFYEKDKTLVSSKSLEKFRRSPVGILSIRMTGAGALLMAFFLIWVFIS